MIRSPIPPNRGRSHEASCSSGVGAAPAGPASSAGLPGGLGSPSAPTTGGRPQGWTGQDERSESSAIGLAKSRPSESRKHGPEAQNRRVKRREACRSASWTGVPPAGGTGLTVRRATGAAVRTSACRRFAPSASGWDENARRAGRQQNINPGRSDAPKS